MLSAYPTPIRRCRTERSRSSGGGDTLKSKIQALSAETVTVDIHCETRWSKLDTVWRGVSMGTLLDQVEHDALRAGVRLVPHLALLEERQMSAGPELLDHDEPGFWEIYGYQPASGVEALGGRLDPVASFGDRTVTVTTTEAA